MIIGLLPLETGTDGRGAAGTPGSMAAKTISKHLRGILNAAVTGVTNAAAESLNAGIQRLKRRACGYRNRAKFRTAILFHFGALDLMPEGTGSTHTE